MPEIQSVFTVKLLLSGVFSLLGCNLAMMVYIAKKYIKQIDSDHELLHQLTSEHKLIHKKETAMKF